VSLGLATYLSTRLLCLAYTAYTLTDNTVTPKYGYAGYAGYASYATLLRHMVTPHMVMPVTLYIMPVANELVIATSLVSTRSKMCG